MRVEGQRLAGRRVAEAAGAGAYIAAYQEGGCAATPAFAGVGASAAAANGMQTVGFYDVLGAGEAVVATQPDFQPVRLSRAVVFHREFTYSVRASMSLREGFAFSMPCRCVSNTSFMLAARPSKR
ncbi:hypothetical protein Barb4_04161 [Bacteroidales bacterium Barb4]|nr:hypothetical protein Barb4_04161 [Bacteroidales bacterium Barb4]